MHKIRLALIIVAAVSFTAVSTPTSVVHAACVIDPGNRRAFVGQPRDLFFTAGARSTQYIPHVYVNFNDGEGPQADCGVSAISSITALKVRATYCFVGTCAVGQEEGVDVANSYPPSGPTSYRASGGVSYLQGPVPVIYDGTAPAGTFGTIDFVVNTDDIGINKQILTRVNVYIVAGKPPPTWFTVPSKSGNIKGDSLALNNPLINSNPFAKIFAMHVGNGMTWNHPIALTYNVVSGRWRIRNEDGTPMPIGLVFVVRIDLSALTLTTHEPYTGGALIIDDIVSYNNPYAVIVVTPWSSGTNRMPHPFGVFYLKPHWYVYLQDGASMPNSVKGASAGFFVKIIGAGQYVDDTIITPVGSDDPSGLLNTRLSNGAGTDIVAVGGGRQSGSTKLLRKFCWTTGIEPIVATFNATALPPPALGHYNAVEGKYYGVSMSVGTATIFHEDNTRMADTAPFNVWGPYRADCPPH
jgi:hypothetical protein